MRREMKRGRSRKEEVEEEQEGEKHDFTYGGARRRWGREEKEET